MNWDHVNTPSVENYLKHYCPSLEGKSVCQNCRHYHYLKGDDYYCDIDESLKSPKESCIRFLSIYKPGLYITIK